MTSEGRGILSPVRLVAPWRKALQALDFQNREPPRITGIRDVMVTVTVTVPVPRRLPNRPRATPERADSRQFPGALFAFRSRTLPARGDRSSNREVLQLQSWASGRVSGWGFPVATRSRSGTEFERTGLRPGTLRVA